MSGRRMKSKARTVRKPRGKRSRTSASRPAKRAARKGPMRPYSVPQSYEEALLAEIVRGNGGSSATDESIAFSSVLSSLTPSLRDMHFRYGMRSGRLLFKIYSNMRDSRYRNSPELGLLDFLEKAGYRDVRYVSMGDWFRIELRCGRAFDAGINAHSFESGLISGFMGSAEGSAARVGETRCMLNGAESCMFETDGHGRGRAAKQGIESLDSAMDWLSDSIGSAEARKPINSYYCNLVWETLLHDEYRSQSNDLAHYCGGAVARRMDMRGNPMKALETTVSMLNLGRLSVRPGKGVVATLSFDASAAKRSFAELSLSFIRGFLEGSGSCAPLRAEERASGNSYTVAIAEE